MSLLKFFDQPRRSWSVNDLSQAEVGLAPGLTENEEESEDRREGSDAETFHSPCVVNSNLFILRRNSRSKNEVNNQDSGLQNKESQMGNMLSNDIEKEEVQAAPMPRPIEVLCQNQEDQAAMDNAPAWAKVLYREVKQQTAQYNQLKVQFTAFKAVINQRLNEHEASLDFYNSKHEDFEMQRDNTERDLDCLHQRSDDLSSHITDLEAKIDDLEQYSRRNCLILNGCQEKQAESQPVIHDQDVNEQKDQEEDNTDEIVLDVFRNIMDMRISIDEIERTHRLGRKAIINSSREDKSPKSGRPIIIKFSTYRKRQEIFSNKKKLKGSGLVLTENLTKTRMHLLAKAKEIVGVKNCWTVDGRIVAIRRDKKIVTISREQHLEKLHL